MVSKNIDSPKSKLFATEFVQKILEAISLLLFICLGSLSALFSSGISPSIKSNLIAFNVLLGILILLGVINFLKKFYWLTRITRYFGRLFPWKEFTHKAVTQIQEMESEIHKAANQHLKATLLAFTSTMISTFFIYLRPQLFFYFSQKTLFSFPQLSLVFALDMILASLFWITPGGLGIAEGGRIGIFALVGIAQGDAVAFSFAVKAIELFFVRLGVISLFRFGSGMLVKKKNKPKSANV
ncbi:MAG: flippase-like domain-containing protein [Bacteroidales bacterium]|nr:flippase-like domain-containing protein [Bacteroidales bacterium]